jgi:hypothetical protein
MEEELSRIPLNGDGEEGASYTDQQIGTLDDQFLSQDYHHNVSSVDDKASMEHQDWAVVVSEKCNLIVNYLPHEIDDNSLKVSDVS